MASSHYQCEPPIQGLDDLSQQYVSNSNGVNSITQLSIADSCDSPPTTSNHLMFICQTNTNLYENRLFPLAGNFENTTKHIKQMPWHNLIKYLKSERIIKNIEIFKNFKSKQKHNLNNQQFPFAERHTRMEKFPCTNTMEDNLNNHFKRKITKLKKLKFPIKLANDKRTFRYNHKELNDKNYKELGVKRFKMYQLNSKLTHHSNLKRSLRKLLIDKNLKIFTLPKALHFKVNKEYPLQDNLHLLYRNNKKDIKFPLNLSKNKGKFPFVNKSQTKTNLYFQNHKEQFQNKQMSQTLQNTNSCAEFKNQNLTKRFPCQLIALACVSKFPINKQFMQYEHSFNNNLGNLNKVNMSKNSKTSIFLPSLAMTKSDIKIKNIDNEHVLQVQYAQTHLEENPRSLTTNEHNHPPPQPAKANRIYDDVNILTDINSLNNTPTNEVGYYAETIELLQHTIITLFEKIQNSLTTNHNIKHESTNAAKYDHGDVNSRFALTPPMSITSVRNSTESNNNDEEVLFKKYDLGDLCDHQVGQIVECSDVRDTLAEAVDYGVTKVQTKSTGSFLGKSEEPTSPISLFTNPLNESKYTSFKDHINANKLLAKNNVFALNEEINGDVKHNLECDSNNTTDTENKSNELTDKTVTNTRDIAKSSEMTVTLLKTKEQDNTKQKNSLQTNEAFDDKDNILCSGLQIKEMKYEMNRVQGALPSSVSERSLFKNDKTKTGTSSTRLSGETSLSINMLPHTLTSTGNNNDSSYGPRSSLKNESISVATTLPKRSPLTTHLRQDGITDLSTLNTNCLNDTISNRAALNTTRTSGDNSGDTLSHRWPSLGSLRNAQSTSLLSVDMPRCTPLPPLGPTDKPTLVNLGLSIDSSVLPERTRFRRQRRLRTQYSNDELEDPLERLNILKARIAASLSEVKGVLKQYSTEVENENENQTAAAMNSVSEIKEDEKKEGPIKFRFVKKIRRRSLFTEDDDEPEQKETLTNAQVPIEETDKHVEKQLEIKYETDNCKLKTESILPKQIFGIVEVYNEKSAEKLVEAKDVAKTPLLETTEKGLNTNIYTLKKEEAQETLQELAQAESKPPIMILEQQSPADEPHRLKEEAKGAIPKQPTVNKQLENENSTQELPKKTKKIITVKSRDPSRRASLAAVEGSKIEPPLKLAIPKIQRRPSDSEAVVKKKLITDKVNTSGVVQEVTPKSNILKVKRSSIKINNNSQLATKQTKLKKEVTTANAKSDNLVKPIDKDDKKSIHTDKSNDVLMPKQPEAARQQQINTEITSERNVLLPKQLVIDDAVSLNEKTIKNSMLPPRQYQQQQQYLEKDQQATVNSTATNFISNDLQAKGAMLENVTTALSSSAASIANGQIKHENVAQQEDFHDLLQQETAVIKPSTTNKQNELKEVKLVESDQSTVKNTTANLNGNLESSQTTTKEEEQKQKSPTLHQQVIATTDAAHVKSYNDNNKHEDIKAKLSLKEPCQDKTTTSSHVVAEHKQRGDEQSITNVDDTKTVNSPHNSISSTSDITHKTTTALLLPSESQNKQKAEESANQQNTMPEFKLAPAPVQTADIISHPELHKKKIIIKKIVRQTSTDKTKKFDLQKPKSPQETEHTTIEPISDKSQTKQVAEEVLNEPNSNKEKSTQEDDQDTSKICSELVQDELTEECLESIEKSESKKPKKERKVKKKVIIKRQKRRLSIGDSFFQSGNSDEQQNAEIETLEKAIAYVTDDDSEQSDEKDEAGKVDQDHEKEKKPLKSCILHKEYNIGDEVLYAERFKKTQIKWRRGRVKERITSISYLLDIDGKDVSSHINYLKRFTGRKVSFGGKEYLEIDYEQLAEEEEKAEKLQRRTYSIWNMV